MLLKVNIQSLKDVEQGRPAIEDINNSDDTTEAEKFTVAILEGGTVSGATSLMFAMKLKDGKTAIAEITANQFDMLTHAFRGAQERFKNDKV